MKVYCIQKVRDASGKILYYAFKMENGNVITGSREDIIKEMKTHQYGYEFTNLQLDKAGRLVDKSIKEVKVDENKQKATESYYVQQTYEEMYKEMLQDDKCHFSCLRCYQDNKDSCFLEPYLSEKLKNLNNCLVNNQCRDIDEVPFMEGFDRFIRSKNDVVLKITVKINCPDKIQVIGYGHSIADFSPAPTTDGDILEQASKNKTTIKTEILGNCNVDKSKYKLVTYYSDRYTKNGLSFASYCEDRFVKSAEEFIEKEREADAKYLNQNKNSNKASGTKKVNINKKMLTQEETQEIYRTATKLGRLVLRIKQMIRLFNMFS